MDRVVEIEVHRKRDRGIGVASVFHIEGEGDRSGRLVVGYAGLGLGGRLGFRWGGRPPGRKFEEDPEEEPVRMDTFEIVMDGGVFEVTGPGMERLIDSVNFDDLESMNWFHRMLRKMGVIDALREKGAGEGSTVRIAGMEFDFVE